MPAHLPVHQSAIEGQSESMSNGCQVAELGGKALVNLTLEAQDDLGYTQTSVKTAQSPNHHYLKKRHCIYS